MKQHALAWAARGFRVFPLAEGSKKPAWAKWDWTEKASSDPELIDRWWSVADYNIGVLTTGLIVVDADNKNGKTGSLEYLERGWPTDTLSVRTPTGGEHFYFEGPDRQNSVDLVAVGLDIRAKNGYVIAPGSYLDPALPENKGVGGHYTLTQDARVAWVPTDLVNQLTATRERTAEARLPATELDKDDAVVRATEYAAAIEAAVFGAGADAYTFKVVCTIKDFGVSDAQALEILADNYLPRCIAPRTPEEQFNWLVRKVENAYAYGSRQAGTLSPYAEFAGVSVPEPIYGAPALLPEPSGWFDHGDDWNVNVAWLYYKLLPQAGSAMLVGPAQAGKTFVALDLARSLATGKTFFQHEPDLKGGTILLYAGTEGSGLEERLAALQEPDRLPISATRVHGLREVGKLQQLQEQMIAKSAEMMEKHGVPVRLIVLETLSASGLLADENSNSEAAAAMAALAQLGRSLNALVLVTHHPPKNGGGERGASSIRGSADYILEVIREGNGAIRDLELTKARNAPQRMLGSFSLIPVTLGKDDRGRDVQSLSVSSGEPQTRVQKVAGASQEFMEILSAALYEQGEEIEGRQMILEAEAKSVYRDRKAGSRDPSNVNKTWPKQLVFAEETGAVEPVVWMGRRYLAMRTG